MANQDNSSNYFVPDFEESGDGGKKGAKNHPRSTRIIWIITFGVAAVLGIIVFSMDDNRSRRDTGSRTAPPEVQEVKQASGLYSNADAIRESLYRNMRDQIAAELAAANSSLDARFPAEGPEITPKRNVKIVHKAPSPEYLNAQQQWTAAFKSDASVGLDLGKKPEGANGATNAGGGDTLDQLMSSYQSTGSMAMDAVRAGVGDGGMSQGIMPRDANSDRNATSVAHQDRANSYVGANTNRGGTSVQNEYLSSSRRAPLSKYELKAGSIVSGVMVGGINSDLPGTILGQVTENVYDTSTGRYLLIPQGSRMVGAYDSHVVYGQNRVLVVWNRIIFPDGTSLNLEGMLGSDQRGYAGFKQRIDHHYSRMLGAALFASVFVAAGKEVTKDDTRTNADGTRTETVFAEALMENITNVATTMIEKNLNIAPTLRILPGYRFSIITTKDVSFAEPYVVASGGVRR